MTSKSLAVVPQPGALSHAPLRFNADERKMIRDSFANGASDSEFKVLMAVAEARGLNPLLKQIHFVKRWDSNKRTEVWAYQTSIDGLRAVAQRTGNYDGQDDPTFEYEESKALKLARVNVYRKGIGRPFTGTARFREYAQTKKDGSLTSFWATKPHIMLAKCAEALALRKAFPEDTGGLYVPEEAPTARSATTIDAEVVRERSPAIAGQLMARLEEGFSSMDDKRAWAAENKAVKEALPAEDQARVADAFKRAPIVQQKSPEPPEKEAPPDDWQPNPDEEPLLPPDDN